jgi:hypothetical protein
MPPTAKARSTPAILAAVSTASFNCPGGVARITSPTPAALAGMAVISTVEG